MSENKKPKITAEQFKEKYEFSKNMDKEDIRKLAIFITMLILRLGLSDKGFLEDLMDDVMFMARTEKESE